MVRRHSGVVVFGGTRLSLPNTKFAPVTPLACGQGSYPCRSQFDSIVYVLGTETGQAAYDLNSAGDDAYRVFRDSRLVAISMQADPDPARGGSRLNLDEGLIKTTPKPPPPPGVPPTAHDGHRERGLQEGGGPAGADDPLRLDGLPVGAATPRRPGGPARGGWAPWPFGRGGVPGGGCPISLQASLEVATGVTFRS